MKKIFSIILLMTVLIISGGKSMEKNYEKATFAGGCFWCIEEIFEQIPGVKEAISGYTGGFVENPTYEQVCSGTTGHREAVQVIYDPSKVRYEDLLKVFFANIDPTDEGGQFADRGSQYKTAVYYHNEQQKKIAEEYIQKLNKSGLFSKPVVTEVLPAQKFYPAEEYHQGYYKKNPQHYYLYKEGSGRKRWSEIFGKKIRRIN